MRKRGARGRAVLETERAFDLDALETRFDLEPEASRGRSNHQLKRVATAAGRMHTKSESREFRKYHEQRINRLRLKADKEEPLFSDDGKRQPPQSVPVKYRFNVRTERDD